MTQDFFEWEAVDQFGNQRQYQSAFPCANGGAVAESTALENLKRGFPNLTIKAIRRIVEAEAKPATGVVEKHAFQRGIVDSLGNAVAKMSEDEAMSIVEGINNDPELRKAYPDAQILPHTAMLMDAIAEAKRSREVQARPVSRFQSLYRK